MKDDASTYGIRIKAFRKRRGWTQAEASTLLGFRHRQSLAAIEAGARGLSAQELVRAANVFGIDVGHFSDPFVVSGEAEFSWRRSPGITPEEIEGIELKVGRVFGAYRHLRHTLGIGHGREHPATGLAPTSGEAEAATAGEEIARRLSSLPLGGDRLATAVEESLGIAVLNMDLPRGVSGVACRLEGLNGIVVNRGEPGGRRSFNLAHELFHVLTWSQMPPRRFEDASQSGDGRQGSETPPIGADGIPASHGSVETDATNHVKAMADAFASGLLMPSFHLEGIDGVGGLPREVDGLSRWLNAAAASMSVSSMALARRLNSLGYLPDEHLGLVLRSRRLTHNGAAGPAPLPLSYGKAFIRTLIRGIEEGILPMEAATDVTGLDERELGRLAQAFDLPRFAPAGSEWEEMRVRMSNWAGYADGWDGDGSIAPSHASLRQAEEFTREAEGRGIAPSAPRLYGDGEVEFGWRKDRASASVAFLGDGHVVAYVRRAPRDPMFKLDRAFTRAGDLGDLMDALREAF